MWHRSCTSTASVPVGARMHQRSFLKAAISAAALACGSAPLCWRRCKSCSPIGCPLRSWRPCWRRAWRAARGRNGPTLCDPAKGPHACPLRVAAAPRGGAFCLGAALRQKNPRLSIATYRLHRAGACRATLAGMVPHHRKASNHHGLRKPLWLLNACCTSCWRPRTIDAHEGLANTQGTASTAIDEMCLAGCSSSVLMSDQKA